MCGEYNWPGPKNGPSKKNQRKLKLKLIQKHFHNVKITYIQERDVYEARKQRKLIYACYAYCPIGDIISGINREASP